MGDIIQEYKPLILKLLVGALGGLVVLGNRKLNLNLNADEVKSFAGMIGAIILGISIHFAAKYHAGINSGQMKLPAPAAPGTGGGGSGTAAGMILILLAAGLVIGVGGCSGINARWAATWTKSETALMADLSAYVAADPGKQKPSADDPTGPTIAAKEQALIQKHLATIQTGIRGADVNEETSLMAELLAYFQGDPKFSDARKLTRGDLVKAHLDDFNSLRR